MSKEKRSSVLNQLMVLAFVWGLTETFASEFLRAGILKEAYGSIMMGCAFFFLAAGYHAIIRSGISRFWVLCMPVVPSLLRLYEVLLVGIVVEQLILLIQLVV